MGTFLVKRYGQWFRPGAVTTTPHLWEAGIFNDKELESLENIDGIAFYPLANMMETLTFEFSQMMNSVERLKGMQRLAIDEKARNSAKAPE